MTLSTVTSNRHPRAYSDVADVDLDSRHACPYTLRLEQIGLNSVWADFLLWLKDNQVGDLTGIAGIIISIGGFFATLIGVFRSKAAAERAEEAAKSARESIRMFDTVVDFTSAIAILEEIKRAHRSGQWILLPDRYAAIRKLLISLRSSNGDLSDEQISSIQSALANLTSIERRVEKSLSNPDTILNHVRFNNVISDDIDKLFAVLSELKTSKTGA